MKKTLVSLLLVLPLAACSVVQPMVDSVTDFFADKPEQTRPMPEPEKGPAPRLTYDQAAVECNQEASRPGGTDNFNFCMRGKGWAPR